VRIRDNQRRSRTRRKELIDDLQARVKEYERKGVTATQQMQHAARYVALENTRLRTLLARHGVQQAEVDAYLRSCDGNEAIQGLATDIPAMPLSGRNPPSASTSRCSASTTQTTNKCQPANHTLEASNSQLHIPKHQTPSPLVSAEDSKLSGLSYILEDRTAQQPLQLHKEPAVQTTAAPECPNTADCFCPPTVTPSNQSIDNGLEISCETAASIIIEMRGQGDVDSIRASLGCAGRESCTVRNSTVLQIMDEN
jgi:hypothetical protein